MTMKKIYVKPFMKEHKLLHTNSLLVMASKLNDGKVYEDNGNEDGDEVDDGF